MKKFLLLLHDDMEAMHQISPKQMEALISEHMQWVEELTAANHFIAGEGLDPRSIKITGKDSIVKDGGFIETKEMIGGFYFLQAKDLEEATALAKGCPCHQWGGTTEVRPVMDYEQA